MKIRGPRTCTTDIMRNMVPQRVIARQLGIPRGIIGRGYRRRRMRGGNFKSFLRNARGVINTSAMRVARAVGMANKWLKKKRAISRGGAILGSAVGGLPGLAIRAGAALAGQVGYGRRRRRQRGSGCRMVVVRRRR